MDFDVVDLIGTYLKKKMNIKQNLQRVVFKYKLIRWIYNESTENRYLNKVSRNNTTQWPETN